MNRFISFGHSAACAVVVAAGMASLAHAQTIDPSKVKVEFLKLYQTGNHPKAAEMGMSIPVDSPIWDANTRMKLAQSLSWSGRSKEALAHYQRLLGTNYEAQARVAMGNAMRWDEGPEKARPQFVRALQVDPRNKDATAALEQVDRQLRPKTTVSMNRLLDTGDMDRRGVTVAHTWRDKSYQHIFGVEVSGTRNQYASPVLDVRQQDMTLRYQNIEMNLRPSFHLTMQRTPFTHAFAGVSVQPRNTPLTLTLESVNWGVSAISARALNAKMTATHGAVAAAGETPLGYGRGRVDLYKVSDGNRITSSSWYLQPGWRPLGASIKPYLSVETRRSSFNTLDYWSPANGSGIWGAGLLGEWSAHDWTLYLAGQSSRRLFGDAGTGWSLSGGAQKWVTKDFSIGANFWGMSSVRDGAQYRAHTVGVTGEKLW